MEHEGVVGSLYNYILYCLSMFVYQLWEPLGNPMVEERMFNIQWP